MKETQSDVVFNRAILFILFAFECAKTGDGPMLACSAALVVIAVLNILKSARIYMED